MNTLTAIIVFTFLGSIGSLIGGVLLLSRKEFALKISHFLASFAAGTLLGTAFLDLLPEAIHMGEERNIPVFFWTLVGVLVFFLLERFIHAFHHHDAIDGEHHHERKTSIPLIIIGDTMHNMIDGILIAATFMVSIPLGMVTTFAVIAHEIPQEIGDFGLLLHKGMEQKQVLLTNVFSASVSLLTAVLTYYLGSGVADSVPFLLSIAAGFFIYIALSDLIPEIHHENRKGFAAIETFLLLLGVAFIWFSVSQLEHSHSGAEADHAKEQTAVRTES